MHIFTITAFKPLGVTATLLATDNPFINGKIVGTNPYKTQELMTVGVSYTLSCEAIKIELSLDKTYEVTGSWIKGVLHLTSAKEKLPETFKIIDGKYTELV